MRTTALASLITVLLAFTAPRAVAQAGRSLRGQVTDSLTHAAVEGARVRLLPSGRTTVTDFRGHFVLESVRPGTYTLRVSLLGYGAAERPVVVPDSAYGTADGLEIALVPRPEPLAGIDVVGARGTSLARLPGSATAIDRYELEQIQPLSANEVFKRVPGVHVQEEEGMGFRANIGVRGLDPDRSRTVLMLEDGVPVALAPYGEPEMYYTPPIDRMERIEVVKGSGSILFGPQTVGGVVNFVTPDPPAEAGGRVV
ncbi:MAG: TonB-dependent receptor plug domain-containing protein, partial [Gemmatimonadales bacterium]